MPYFTNRGIMPLPVAGGGDYTTGLQYNWPFTDAQQLSGTESADIVAGNTANATGGITSAAFNGPTTTSTARALDGVSGTRMDIAAPRLWNTGSYSIGGWVFVTNVSTLSSGGSNQRFFNSDATGADTEYLQMFNASATPGGFGVDTSGTRIITTSQVLSNNTWAHIFFTNSGGGGGGTFTLYVDGTSRAFSSTAAAGFTTIIHALGTALNTDGNLAGRMYDWRIYSRALVAADVLALYNATK